ncbi:MAG TPA: UDP-N-acetylmuramoyl-L-alanyl-D-glutamate--2,6-diaminopimelate ligase [Firmicutes bacterium]|jgi:UDP-N-acetylmuramoyl-L-alanyl-D-glutamate--2,6-diaminopimelate ligase|nr:UDP-N-acetylmuramoyl-L-alanyl-D-glutamate--2,6-diaminopimelate ligase [Bacillota bacterium]
MKLKVLLEQLPVVEFRGDAEVEITSVEYDSRQVSPGALFIALRGSRADGHDYLREAVARGAVAVLAEEPRGVEKTANLILVEDTRKLLPAIGRIFYDDPAARLQLLGVVGTNGKTTSTFFLRSILEAADRPTGLVGTIHHLFGGKAETSGNTTPGPLDLQRLFAGMHKAGIESVVMEVSSHALALGRVAGLTFAGGIFTNITPDHLDFHRSFDEYLQVKTGFFTHLPPEAPAVINIDDPHGRYILDRTSGRKFTYGLSPAALIRAEEIEMTMKGSAFSATTPWGKRRINLKLPGRFNIYNALGALGLALALGVDLETAGQGLEKLTGVPGRFQLIPGADDFSVVVDYAHTPDGLENLLRTARALTNNRLLVVFGCGGDRDRGKRPEMGRIAARLSDLAIITSDNPRSEDPVEIAREIEGGFRAEARALGRDSVQSCRVIIDRQEAIREAVFTARPGDMLVIAGKGHENRQIFHDRTAPFDDREVAAAALRARAQGLKERVDG